MGGWSSESLPTSRASLVFFCAEERLFAGEHQAFVERRLRQRFFHLGEAARVLLNSLEQTLHPASGSLAGHSKRIREDSVRAKLFLIEQFAEPLQFGFQAVVTNAPDSASSHL